MSVVELERASECILEQPLKAALPIIFTEFGIAISSNSEHQASNTQNIIKQREKELRILSGFSYPPSVALVQLV